eukprot:s7171_g1.t1
MIALRVSIRLEAVASAQAGALPLVWEHLCRQQVARRDMEAMRPYISEVQLMVSDPCAADQPPACRTNMRLFDAM